MKRKHANKLDSVQGIVESLNGVSRYIRLSDIDSTNTYARGMLERGMTMGKDIVVIKADRQSAGRGRHGRSFFSSVKDGLWTSLIVSIDSLSNHFSVNRALSLAICDTVRYSTGREAFIKWPNDIFCSDRKICGILLESVQNPDNVIIAGFGLNVNIEAGQFPPDIAPIATSMCIETGACFDLDAVLATIIEIFIKYRSIPDADLHRAYAQRLYCAGRRIECEGREGIFEGVEPDGRMRMRTGNGIELITSGTIRFIGV